MTVKGIILLRGGYGAQRILDRIDYGLVRRNPKVVVGYSDVTALLVAFWQKAGLVCFHGPVASSSPSPFSEAWMRHAVGSDLPVSVRLVVTRSIWTGLSIGIGAAFAWRETNSAALRATGSATCQFFFNIATQASGPPCSKAWRN